MCSCAMIEVQEHHGEHWEHQGVPSALQQHIFYHTTWRSAQANSEQTSDEDEGILVSSDDDVEVLAEYKSPIRIDDSDSEIEILNS